MLFMLLNTDWPVLTALEASGTERTGDTDLTQVGSEMMRHSAYTAVPALQFMMSVCNLAGSCHYCCVMGRHGPYMGPACVRPLAVADLLASPPWPVCMPQLETRRDYGIIWKADAK
jgi:hypothetical protein